MAAMARRKNLATRKARTSNGSRRRRKIPNGKRARSVLSRARNAMTRAVSGDARALQQEVRQLVSDLEERLERLNKLTQRGASHAVGGVNDLVFGAISGLTGRVGNGARGVTIDAAKFGNQALRRVATEIDRRPLLTLAIAAGVGFLAGLARRDR
jgi:ElaB/YqjD/DUF883 family membrane-anchored ribosome-binding protein